MAQAERKAREKLRGGIESGLLETRNARIGHQRCVSVLWGRGTREDAGKGGGARRPGTLRARACRSDGSLSVVVGWSMPSQRYAQALPPVPVNVTLFRDTILADVITLRLGQTGIGWALMP